MLFSLMLQMLNSQSSTTNNEAHAQANYSAVATGGGLGSMDSHDSSGSSAASAIEEGGGIKDNSASTSGKKC